MSILNIFWVYPITKWILRKFRRLLDPIIRPIINLMNKSARGAVALSLMIFIVCGLSIFLYAAFYYSIMPAAIHSRDVNFVFSSNCDTDTRTCGFPQANFSLMDDYGALLSRGQAYKVSLDLALPESPVNQNLGMFIVHIQFYSLNGQIVRATSRSAILKYKSYIVRTVETILRLPFFIFWYGEEQQTMHVVLFEHFREDPYKQSYGVFIELQNKFVEVYSAKLKISAQFSGLRYILYKWPFTSLLLGVSTNMFFISFVMLISYLKLSSSSSSDRNVKVIDENEGEEDGYFAEENKDTYVKEKKNKDGKIKVN